jgi:type II secretory pathway predicted ATPase ExeA
MVGLPELLDRLSLRRNRSLFSRLHRRLRVDPLTPADTGEYIPHAPRPGSVVTARSSRPMRSP